MAIVRTGATRRRSPCGPQRKRRTARPIFLAARGMADPILSGAGEESPDALLRSRRSRRQPIPVRSAAERPQRTRGASHGRGMTGYLWTAQDPAACVVQKTGFSAQAETVACPGVPRYSGIASLTVSVFVAVIFGMPVFQVRDRACAKNGFRRPGFAQLVLPTATLRRRRGSRPFSVIGCGARWRCG